jgi:hypothetical protein
MENANPLVQHGIVWNFSASWDYLQVVRQATPEIPGELCMSGKLLLSDPDRTIPEIDDDLQRLCFTELDAQGRRVGVNCIEAFFERHNLVGLEFRYNRGGVVRSIGACEGEPKMTLRLKSNETIVRLDVSVHQPSHPANVGTVLLVSLACLVLYSVCPFRFLLSLASFAGVAKNHG